MFKFVNIVATVKMENKFNLDDLLNKLPNAQSSKHWVNIRLPVFNNYIAFYKNGKFLITGARSKEELDFIAKYVGDYLKKHGIYNKIVEIQINNCVAVDQLEFNVDLEEIFVKLLDYEASYEPEQFPGMNFKDEYGISYLLFSSGKIIITGGKSLDSLEDCVNEFKELIKEKNSIF